jgi:CRISPR/Cas system CSM-associated protein Csm3 (group 7 of RAMP superfamily)
MPKLDTRMPRTQHTIGTRIIARGILVLQTPTHLGNGDSEGPTDLALQRDSVSQRALLIGSSIAGALRNYLLIRERGFCISEPIQEEIELKGLAELLFGGLKGSDEGSQSPLIICDSLSTEETPYVELRDGVRIDSRTRTPAHQAKYDVEVLAAGTCFPLQLELNIPISASSDTVARLRQALALVLDGLAQGEIGIGMKKRRGLGRCHIEAWQVWSYDLTKPQQLLRWLTFDPDDVAYQQEAQSLDAVLGPRYGADARNLVRLEATFSICDSLLIRAGQDEGAFGPDVRHLHARQADGKEQPIISGTSLAGVLRHRAERIINTLGGDGGAFVQQLFGDAKGAGQASRIIVHESMIDQKKARTDLVQNRVAIDRFTGGALDGALFNEQPLFAKPETRATLRIELQNPKPGEIGLLLLLLKDLWTGDLPIGGESSIGRGRLQGEQATLTQQGETLAVFKRKGTHGVTLEQGDGQALNTHVALLKPALLKEGDHA